MTSSLVGSEMCIRDRALDNQAGDNHSKLATAIVLAHRQPPVAYVLRICEGDKGISRFALACRACSHTSSDLQPLKT
eukprot:7396265-Prorocentrum_lima.AAC.1